MTRQRRRRLIRLRRTGTGIALVSAISCLAGMTDAIGFLIGGDFVSFMTGNTTRSAIFLSQGDWTHGLVLILAIAVFVAGNALGVILAHGARRRAFVVLGSVGLLLALAAIASAPMLALARFYLIVLAMGLVNAAVEHIEGLPIGLTYVTGALSRFGRGLGRFILGDRRIDWTIQIVPWIGMLGGALCGAGLVSAFGAYALWVACLLAFVLAIATLFMRRSLQHRFNHALARETPATRR